MKILRVLKKSVHESVFFQCLCHALANTNRKQIFHPLSHERKEEQMALHIVATYSYACLPSYTVIRREETKIHLHVIQYATKFARTSGIKLFALYINCS